MTTDIQQPNQLLLKFYNSLCGTLTLAYTCKSTWQAHTFLNTAMREINYGQAIHKQ